MLALLMTETSSQGKGWAAERVLVTKADPENRGTKSCVQEALQSQDWELGLQYLEVRAEGRLGS